MSDSSPPRPSSTSSTASVAATPRTTLRRKKERGSYDRELIESILDEALVAHVGIVDGDGPVVLPMIYARVDDRLYLHGAAANHLLRAGTRSSMCVTVTLVDGLVLSRSAFHHSMNYRSVVIFGRPELVEDVDEKRAAMAALIEHMVPDRSGHTREPSENELRATAVVRLAITEASAKVRQSGPIEEPEDLDQPVWAGVIGVSTLFGPITPDEGRPAAMAVPDHVQARATPV